VGGKEEAVRPGRRGGGDGDLGCKREPRAVPLLPPRTGASVVVHGRWARSSKPIAAAGRCGLGPLASLPSPPLPCTLHRRARRSDGGEIRRCRAPLLLRQRQASLSSGGEGEVRARAGARLVSGARQDGGASASSPVGAEEDCKCNCLLLCWRRWDEEMKNTVAARQRPIYLPNLTIVVGVSLRAHIAQNRMCFHFVLRAHTALTRLVVCRTSNLAYTTHRQKVICKVFNALHGA
jgi:hypothetical protein